jgi:hypothetical protein
MAGSMCAPDRPVSSIGAIAAEIRTMVRSEVPIPADDIRRLVTATTLLYSAAVTRTGYELSLADSEISPTDTVVLTCALLRGQDLNPFDLALWFGQANLDTGTSQTD